MKITAIDARLVDANFRNLIITQIHTDQGITGISEVVTKRFDDATLHGIRNIAENIGLVGQDPRRPALHFERMYRDNQWTTGTVAVSAISAIEMAMWDIKGKELGRPIHELFGGPTCQRVPVYCHVPAGGSPEEFADHIGSALARGYRVVKTTLPVYYGQVRRVSRDGTEYRLGGAAYSGTKGRVDGSHNEHQWTDARVLPAIVAYFAHARQVHGDRVEIWVDCHARLSGASAAQLLRALTGLVELIEEPLPPEDIRGLRLLREASAACGGPRLGAGERTATVYDRHMASMVTEQAVDVFQPDLGNCGGYGQFHELASLAAMHDVAVAPHNPNGPLAVAQGLQAMCFVRNGYLLETVCNAAEDELAAQLLEDPSPLQVHDGYIEVPTAPGVGVSLRAEGLAARPFQRYYHATR